MKTTMILMFVWIGFSTNISNAQTNSIGTITGGAGVYIGTGVPTISLFPNSAISGEIPVGIATINTYKPFELNIGIAKPISLGLQYTPTSFNVVAGPSLVRAKSKTLGVNINLYLINANRFSMEASLTPNKIWFNPLDLGFIGESLKVKVGGTGFKSRLKLNFLLAKNAGFYISLGYDIHRIRLKEFSVSNEDSEIEEDLNYILNNNIALNIRGISAGVGLVFKIDTKKEK